MRSTTLVVWAIVVWEGSFGFSLSVKTKTTLTIPAAGPSWEFLAPGRKVSLKSVDWCEGRWLPLQRYRAKSSPAQIMDSKAIGSLTLQDIEENPKEFRLSRSAVSLLQDTSQLTSLQQQQLLQKIQVELIASQPVPMEAVQILYCDGHICVVNKPSGVLSVPGPRRNPSLLNLIYELLNPTGLEMDQMVVHRLDMATSGILVYALSLEALSKLHKNFKDRKVHKTYEALVEGHFISAPEGEIDVLLERDPDNLPFMRIAQPKTNADEAKATPDELQLGSDHKFIRQAPKESLTTWTLVGKEFRTGENRGPVSRLELHPWTGRTHQLRVHCAQALGAPIVGDDIYGSPSSPISCVGSPPLCLHAKKLCICHPISGASMIFESEPSF